MKTNQLKQMLKAEYQKVFQDIDLQTIKQAPIVSISNGFEFKVSKKKLRYRILSFVSIFAVILGFSSLHSYRYFAIATSVTIDINPSIELLANDFDQVTQIKTYNSQGAQIINELSLHNVKVDEAVVKIIDLSIEKNYMKKSEINHSLMIVISKLGSKDEMIVKEYIEHQFIGYGVPYNKDFPFISRQIDYSQMNDYSKAYHVSPGKAGFMYEINSVNSKVNQYEFFEKNKEKSINELFDLLKSELIAKILATKKGYNESQLNLLEIEQLKEILK